jgi:carboxyl-terminal processing protease
MRSQKSCIIFLIFFLGLIHNLYAQKNEISCSDLPVLTQLLEKYHIRPITFSDSIAADIKHDFCKVLDPDGLFFTKSDYTSISEQELDLQSPESDINCQFLKFSIALYKQKLLYADTILTKLSIDFTQNDSVIFFSDYVLNLSEDSSKQYERWIHWIKYKTLDNIFESSGKNGASDNSDTLKIRINTSAEKMRAREIKNIEGYLRYAGGFENFVTSQFFNCIANRFDPHTEFFMPSEKEDFENSLSTQTYIFGFSLEENTNGEVTIKHLFPGSAAWKSNELHIGDQLLQIKFQGQQAIDLSEAGIYEANSALASSTSDQITLTIKKTNGQVKSVTLKKEAVANDENLITGYILKGDKSVGYISLPDFYTDFDFTTKAGCANDMAKEIIKLKNESIDGLIVDLRYNGGGSIQEALDLAGIFIDEGPLCIVGEKDTTPVTLKDVNRGTIYNGPLIILINELSASASELFASALQDYNRALIVGNNTYGKATGQTIVPLDASFGNKKTKYTDTKSEKGFLKITDFKLYRITCKSNQLTGMVPDIVLPGFLDETAYHESGNLYALPKDLIVKKMYYKPLQPLPVSILASQSNKRILSDSCFKKIIVFTDSLESTDKKVVVVPLSIKAFEGYYVNEMFFTTFADSIFIRKSESFDVLNNAVDKEILKVDNYRQAINDLYIEYIKNDIYIDEAYKIMIDFIKIKP